MRLNQELIEEWWRDRRDGGIYRSERSIDDPAWDRAIKVGRFVSESAASADDLPTVLMLLVQGAASDGELASLIYWVRRSTGPTGRTLALEAAEIAIAEGEPRANLEKALALVALSRDPIPAFEKAVKAGAAAAEVAYVTYLELGREGQ